MSKLEYLDSVARCLPPRLAKWTKEFCAAGFTTAVDPLLLAAVCDRESGGGDYLKPTGPGGTGDGGHGHGLMQIDGRYHSTFLAMILPDGRLAWQVPAWNIAYGAELLAVNLRIFGQDVVPAIASYNASSKRVMKAYGALPPTAQRDEKLRAVDPLTTQGNYVSDVFRRMGGFQAKAVT